MRRFSSVLAISLTFALCAPGIMEILGETTEILPCADACEEETSPADTGDNCCTTLLRGCPCATAPVVSSDTLDLGIVPLTHSALVPLAGWAPPDAPTGTIYHPPVV